MSQSPVSHSPLQTAFGFGAIALLVVITGLGPRMASHPEATGDSLTPAIAATPDAPSQPRHGVTTLPAIPPADTPEAPVPSR
jgi:hypothetical protein